MSNASRRNRHHATAEQRVPRQPPAATEKHPFLPARPRPPQPWLLALSAVLFGLWLILLLLLVAIA